MQLTDPGDVLVDSAVEYRSGEGVRIRVRRRSDRYDLDDDGNAVALAGKPSGWLDTAERVVAADGFNVNRRGVVFVPVVHGRDIDDLCRRLAECSRQVYLALIELRD